MEEENEEGMEGDHDHNTVAVGHQMEEDMMEGAADRGLLDMVAAWVPPPADAIKQYSIRGVRNRCHEMKSNFAFYCSMNFSTQTTNSY